MASTASTSSIPNEGDGLWLVYVLKKVLTPVRRNVVATEVHNSYHRLCKPPDEIDKHVFAKYKKKLPPTKLQLKYKNINNNKAPKAYSKIDRMHARI